MRGHPRRVVRCSCLQPGRESQTEGQGSKERRRRRKAGDEQTTAGAKAPAGTAETPAGAAEEESVISRDDWIKRGHFRGRRWDMDWHHFPMLESGGALVPQNGITDY